MKLFLLLFLLLALSTSIVSEGHRIAPVASEVDRRTGKTINTFTVKDGVALSKSADNNSNAQPLGTRITPIASEVDRTTNLTVRTITVMDGVRVIQPTGSNFSKTQLDQTASILYNTNSLVRSKIDSITSVKNVNWGGENTNNKISVNIDNEGKQRNFQQILTHEIGHTAAGTLSQQNQNNFIKSYDASKTQKDFATDYNRNWVEDYADTYMKYKMNRSDLEKTDSIILKDKINIVDQTDKYNLQLYRGRK
ncbi:MAG: hypothetical protein WC976_07075 [Caldisericia bacterium]